MPLTRRVDTGPDAATRTLVLARAGWRCEVCGARLQPGAYSLQHRRARGMGGTTSPTVNGPENLLACCGSATTGCHGWIEHNRTEARGKGWAVAQGADPARIPVDLHDGRRVLLTGDGGYLEVAA